MPVSIRLYLLLVILAPAPAFGELYEYKDRNGNLVITDSPPSGVDARKKSLDNDRVFHSNRSAKDYPDYEDKTPASRNAERPNKRYDRVSAIMYMTDW